VTEDELKSELYYDQETGIFMWKYCSSRRTHLNSRLTGKTAGWNTNQGYICVTIHGIKYLAHRLAWFYVNGQWPRDQIDHINGVRNDNRIANLREASNAENRQNAKRNCNNKSGFKGVSLKSYRGGSKWVAQFMVCGKQKYLGLFDTPEDAHQAYCNAAFEVRGKFARTS
jgi:hypothetical protein